MRSFVTNYRRLGRIRLIRLGEVKRNHHPDPLNPKTTKGWTSAVKVIKFKYLFLLCFFILGQSSMIFEHEGKIY